MKLSIMVAVLLCFTVSGVGIASDKTQNEFYKDKERGWFWFEDPEKVVEEKQAKPAPPVSSQKPLENIPLDAKWLRENLERLTLAAMSNPTETNLANYAYAQRLMMDMSSRFSSKMSDFMLDEPLLDETSRRPTSSFSLKEFKAENSNMVNTVMLDIKTKTKGLWFFYSSTCSFCIKMIPIMNRFQQNTDMEILAISLDGGILPGMENFEIVMDYDNSVARKFGVTHTPTTYLVLGNDKPELVASGLKTLPELEAKIIRAAKINDVITKEQYAKTKSVYKLNMYNNEEGQLYVNEEMLNKDPNYLAEALRKQLGDVQPYGTRVIQQASNK